jgi:hypothetical protein
MPETTPTPSEMSTPPLITLAPEGDVILDICDLPAPSNDTDSPRTQYRVASQALCAASPVFRMMFSKTSPFEEATSLHDPSRTVPITVKLEDNSVAFEVVLNVLHFRNRHVEKQPALPMLLVIAKITDKYQLYEALMFVTDSWYTIIKESDVTLLEKVTLAWAFRYEELFRETTREILKSVELSFSSFPYVVVIGDSVTISYLSEYFPECLTSMHCGCP